MTINFFSEIEFNEDDEKEILICSGCNKEIRTDYYYDRITQKVYCSKECYLEQIGKEYFD